MATTTKRGNSYTIKVSCGYDENAKQIVKTKTWKPPPGLTPKQIKKELVKAAALFEEECAKGEVADKVIKFKELSEFFIKEYAEISLKIHTVTEYKWLSKRTNAEIGYLRADKITPRHIQSFINASS